MSRRQLHAVLPPLLALFDKRIDGDDALLHLARRRFSQAGIGPEFHAGTPDALEALLPFAPRGKTPIAVHLPRRINLFDETGRQLIIDFASRFQGRVTGLIIHDQPELDNSFDEYCGILHDLEKSLARLGEPPLLFVEYTASFDPDLFIELHRSIPRLSHICPCIDVGHVGMWQVKKKFSALHAGTDVCSLSPADPALPGLIDDIRIAVESALDATQHVIREIGRDRKHVHFHLHDGHPLYAAVTPGKSDHRSFLGELLLPANQRELRALRQMYGPAGLREIVAGAFRSFGAERVSFSLEIHPHEGRLPLDDASGLFAQWTDKGNAERMNFWLSELMQNHQLLADACIQAAGAARAAGGAGTPRTGKRGRAKA